MAGWVAPLVHIGDGVKRIQMRGYNKMELSDGVFMVWTTLMLLGVYTLACISCHGGMGSPLGAHWRQCQEDSDLPEDFVKYL